LAIAALPVALVVILVFTAVMGLIGGLSAASGDPTCGSEGTGGGGGAAPVSLNGPPANLIPIYQAASNESGLNPDGPAVLAAINRVETNFGTFMGPSSAGAIGWMQFEPETWAEYGKGGDPYNPHDAIFAAARLLKADGAPQNWYQAIFGYNHADWYVQEVEEYAKEYSGEVPANSSVGASQVSAAKTERGSSVCLQDVAMTQDTAAGPPVPGATAKLLPNGRVAIPTEAPPSVKAMITAGNAIAGQPYVWGGHHELGSATNGYDCSSAVSYVMYAGGLLQPGTAGFSNGDFFTHFVAANFVAGGSAAGLLPGPGKWVTLYVESNGAHVYMTIAGVRFDDSSTDRNGAGPNGTNVSMWQPAQVYPGFVASHPANL
jgi:cell wall-associated NlpC family hydrolase